MSSPDVPPLNTRPAFVEPALYSDLIDCWLAGLPFGHLARPSTRLISGVVMRIHCT
jgi:hypothetical protein